MPSLPCLFFLICNSNKFFNLCWPLPGTYLTYSVSKVRTLAAKCVSEHDRPLSCLCSLLKSTLSSFPLNCTLAFHHPSCGIGTVHITSPLPDGHVVGSVLWSPTCAERDHQDWRKKGLIFFLFCFPLYTTESRSAHSCLW